MNAFDLLRPRDMKSALAALAGEKPPTPKAGGMDLLDRMKEGIDQPSKLLDLSPLGLRAIEIPADAKGTLRVGALATLAEVAASDLVRKNALALAQAAGEAATPQVRNVATVGGNVLQRSRCWYYRNADYEPCLKRGGKECFAKEGRNKIHAVFGTDLPCVSVHPSSLGPALVALEAKVLVSTGKGESAKAAADLYVDGSRPEKDHSLEEGALITGVSVPIVDGRRSAYREFQERASYDWALASCAVSFQL